MQYTFFFTEVLASFVRQVGAGSGMDLSYLSEDPRAGRFAGIWCVGAARIASRG